MISIKHGRKDQWNFKAGQKVWLDARNLKLGYNKKIFTKREGPFLIEEKLGPLTYRLKLPKTWKIHHAILLSLYHDTEVHGLNFMKPPPDRWKGYQPQDDSWELEWNLTNAAEVLSQYKMDKKLDKRGKPKWK